MLFSCLKKSVFYAHFYGRRYRPWLVNDWLYIENTYGNNKISNMDKIFDVKFDLNKENSNGLGLYIVSNILNNYNMEYKALQDEEFFIFKIKIVS